MGYDTFIDVTTDIQPMGIDQTIRDLLKIEAHLPNGSTPNLNYSNTEREYIYHLCRKLQGNMQDMIIMGALLGQKLYTVGAMGNYFERSETQPYNQSPV
jgi:hypothetical protein